MLKLRTWCCPTETLGVSMLVFRIAFFTAFTLMSACAADVAPSADFEHELSQADAVCRVPDPNTFQKHLRSGEVITTSQAIAALNDDCGWEDYELRIIDAVARICTTSEPYEDYVEVVTRAELKLTAILDDGKVRNFTVDIMHGRHLSDCPPVETLDEWGVGTGGP